MRPSSLTGKVREKGFAGRLVEGEPLHRHVSLRVGGPAALFAVPENMQDLLGLLETLANEEVPWIVLGSGTNILFANGGYGGCVISLGGDFARIEREEEGLINAGAAVSLAAVLESAAEAGLSGLECLAGIPGTVGGAVCMNAGTRHGEIGRVIRQVRLLDRGGDRWAEGREVGFSYRSSGIPGGEIVLAARLALDPSDPGKVRERMRAIREERKGKQPRELPSAGCWFRNPEGDSAGRLIDEAGMKGQRCGGAEVSRVHANFLVNQGGATASDFLTLAERVRDVVAKKYGIELQEEVRVIHG